MLEDPLVKHAAEGNNAQAEKFQIHQLISGYHGDIWISMKGLKAFEVDHFTSFQLEDFLGWGHLRVVFFKTGRICSRVDAQCDAA